MPVYTTSFEQGKEYRLSTTYCSQIHLNLVKHIHFKMTEHSYKIAQTTVAQD